ncbi:MAG: glycosyltransferase family 61 protein [Verrucomicrobiales bacterium]|nr:glycosyltransferase family 61 protein [Verrucomicrobiales bacterium]
MPAFYHKLAMRTRRWPALHRPLTAIRRLLTESIPMLFVNLLRVLAPAKTLRFGPPKGSFSIYQSLLHENRRPNRVVLTDQGAPKTTDESLLVKTGLQQHAFQPWPIFWSQHRNARLVASTLALLDDQKRICRESVYGDYCLEGDPAWRYWRLPQPVRLAGNWTSLVSRWVPNDGVPTFSHWILDALPRLALLKEFPADTKILVPAKLAAYQKETLALLGLLDRVRCTPEPHIIVENYYFSAPTAMISCYSPYGVNWLRSAFLPLADKSHHGPKRFIIQRKGRARGIKNEAEVNEFFKKLGWAIIDTETLTFAQEIELFANAEAFAGVLGSGFTNGIWSRPGCKVITFMASNWVDSWVEWICDVNKLDYHWQLFPSDHMMMTTVDLNEVKKLLAKAGLDAG